MFTEDKTANEMNHAEQTTVGAITVNKLQGGMNKPACVTCDVKHNPKLTCLKAWLRESRLAARRLADEY